MNPADPVFRTSPPTRRKGRSRILLGVVMLCLGAAGDAAELVVGNGAAYATIADAIAVALPGDEIVVGPGVYRESLRTRVPGVSLRGSAAGKVVITSPTGVFDIAHADWRLERVVIDGAFGAADALVVRTAAARLKLHEVEVRNSGHDCIDLESPPDVSISHSLVHHCLRTAEPACVEQPCAPVVNCAANACRRDAHGIAAGAVRRLTIAHTEIHTFSGDGLQVDADRGAPGWDEVLVESCRFRLAPLPQAIGGFAAGVVPGEEAIDTKTPLDRATPSRLTIRDTVASGFRDGLVRNAAFTLKEHVAVEIDRVTVHDSNIAFRIRGATAKSPYRAAVSIRNAVIYDVSTAIRYEGGVNTIRLANTTIGDRVGQVFDSIASRAGTVIDGRNVLVIGLALPRELAGPHNLAVSTNGFVDVARHDYRLTAESPAIDYGTDPIGEMPVDRDGRPRRVGRAIDLGAYEYPVPRN